MANSRSARKRIRANERKHVRNRAVRSAVRTKVAKARRALAGLDETIDGQAQLLVAVSALDRAAEKGVLHPRNAARRKARLMTLAHRLEVAAEEGDDALAAARARALGGEKGRKAAPSRARAGAAALADADDAGEPDGGEAAEVAPASARRGGARGAAAGTTGKSKATTAKATTAKATTAKATTKATTTKASGSSSTRGRSKS